MSSQTTIFNLKFICVVLQLITLCGCNQVPEEQYNALAEEVKEKNRENVHLKLMVDSLRTEVDFIKHGAPKLKAKIFKYYLEENYGEVSNLCEQLSHNFPGSKEEDDCRDYCMHAGENMAWKEAESFNSEEKYRAFVTNFPFSDKVETAKLKIEGIKSRKFEGLYNDAIKSNVSYKWRALLIEYPNIGNKVAIERKIIELEVNEIMGDVETGSLPGNQKIGTSYSSSSTVSIHNQTPYDLTLRYSGPSVLKITIPSNGYKHVSLTSGSYKVAASAGGLNYAGNEYMSGDYSSKYYITRH